MRHLTAARLEERGRALYRLLATGASLDRLAALDRAVRRGRVTDWPGRSPETADGTSGSTPSTSGRKPSREST